MSGVCRSALAVILSTLAVQLVEKEVSEAARKLHTNLSEHLGPNVVRTPADLMSEGKIMTATYDAVCARTGQPISAGEQVMYFQEQGLVRLDAIKAS